MNNLVSKTVPQKKGYQPDNSAGAKPYKSASLVTANQDAFEAGKNSGDGKHITSRTKTAFGAAH